MRSMLTLALFQLILPSQISAEENAKKCGELICAIGTDGLYNCDYAPCIVVGPGVVPGSNNLPGLSPGSNVEKPFFEDLFSKKAVYEFNGPKNSGDM
jgi:hypothetical protein